MVVLAENGHSSQELVGFDEESGAQEEGKEERSVREVVQGGNHQLDQTFQCSRAQVAVGVDEGLLIAKKDELDKKHVYNTTRCTLTHHVK